MFDEDGNLEWIDDGDEAKEGIDITFREVDCGSSVPRVLSPVGRPAPMRHARESFATFSTGQTFSAPGPCNMVQNNGKDPRGEF